ELDEVDVLQERLEGDAELGLPHERQRTVRLPVEAPDRRDETRLLGVQAGQLHRPLPRVGAVVDEEALLEISRGDLPQALGEPAAGLVEDLFDREAPGPLPGPGLGAGPAADRHGRHGSIDRLQLLPFSLSSGDDDRTVPLVAGPSRGLEGENGRGFEGSPRISPGPILHGTTSFFTTIYCD